MALEFEIDQADILFRDWAAFGSIWDIGDDLRRAVEARGGKIRKGGTVAYFSGRHSLFSAKVEFGAVKVTNRLTDSVNGTRGGRFESTIVIRLEFDQRTTLKLAIARMMDLRRLFTLLIGRPQNLSNMTIIAGSRKKSARYSLIMTTINSFPDVWDDRRKGGEPLIFAVQSPKEMRHIVQQWVKDTRTLSGARRRFFEAFEKELYSIDRLIAAANLFDLIPDHVNPIADVKDKSLLELLAETKPKFKALPWSQERDGALNALGRITAPNLKRKIAAWCKALLEKNGFGELQFVLEQAVDARNHYVHGTAHKFDYEANISMFIFLVKSLEFAFGASYLMRLGWNFDSWLARPQSGDHDFRAFVQMLQNSHLVADLKKLITTEKKKTKK